MLPARVADQYTAELDQTCRYFHSLVEDYRARQLALVAATGVTHSLPVPLPHQVLYPPLPGASDNSGNSSSGFTLPTLLFPRSVGQWEQTVPPHPPHSVLCVSSGSVFILS